MSFFFSFLSFFFKLREREKGYIKLGIRRNGLKVYFFFRRSSCGEYFLFYRLIDFMLFLVLAWRNGSFVSKIFFVFFYPEYLALVPSATNPVQPLIFLFLFSLTGRRCHFRFRVPANHLASTFFLPVSGNPREVTEYKHLFLTVILWRLVTVNSNRRIVVIIFLASQWDTTWQ